MPADTWSVVTVTYNSSATLQRFWDEDRPAEVEWIVVDNGSTDDSVAVARRLGARVVALGRNVGFSAANNIGLADAEGKYTAFLNPDVRARWQDLPALAQAIDHFGGLVSPQLVNGDGSLQPNGRGAPMLLSKVIHRLAPERQSDGYQIVAADDQTKYAFWLMGAAVMGRTDTLRTLRGWSERVCPEFG